MNIGEKEDDKDEESGPGKSTRIIIGVVLILFGLVLFVIFLFVINIDVGTNTDENKPNVNLSDVSESLTYSLASDKEDYRYGDTATFQTTITNISSDPITMKSEQDCADPILLINDTKLAAMGCQAAENEIVLEPGASRSWRWQYKLIKPEQTISAPNEVALEAGQHMLESRWLNEEQESLEFTLE